MDIKNAYMYLNGYVEISVEGFFIKRFINSCFSKGIFLSDLRMENSAFLRVKIGIADFKKIRKIARNTKCKIKIEKKRGLPIFINKYKKRKLFVIFVLAFIIFIVLISRFIWNIEVVGNSSIDRNEIIELLAENGIEVGKRKSSLDLERVINKIRMEREDISWIGIDIKGTNMIVKLNEADMSPEIIDINKPCNIVSDKAGEISKLIVKQGTARVQVGDKVEVGDILVEGVMEGKYTGVRDVHAMADIEVKKTIEKEEKQSLVQDIEVKTGNEEKNIEIKFNKIRINFNKRLSKFQKYDTIITTKKLKFFSNYYFPIEILFIRNLETKLEHKEYTVPELTEKIKLKLETDLNKELGVESSVGIDENLEVENDGINVLVKVIYTVYEEIGTKEFK